MSCHRRALPFGILLAAIALLAAPSRGTPRGGVLARALLQITGMT